MKVCSQRSSSLLLQRSKFFNSICCNIGLIHFRFWKNIQNITAFNITETDSKFELINRNKMSDMNLRHYHNEEKYHQYVIDYSLESVLEKKFMMAWKHSSDCQRSTSTSHSLLLTWCRTSRSASRDKNLDFCKLCIKMVFTTSLVTLRYMLVYLKALIDSAYISLLEAN